MRKILCLIFVVVMSVVTHGQERRRSEPCATDQSLLESIKINPEIVKQIDLDNKKIAEYRRTQQGLRTVPAPETITIPVVVYVVHDGTTLTNLSDAQVQSQIAALNTSFQSTGIKFCLATRAGSGTTVPMLAGSVQNVPGIIHIQNNTLTDHTMTWTAEDALISGTAPSQVTGGRYMRIWVVKSINGSSSGVLGYAPFPNSSVLNGIVMRYDAFGDAATCSGCNLLPQNNEGETLSHEVGHYLNLRHVFQGSCNGTDNGTLNSNGNPICEEQGDLVCDTPQINHYHTGCPFGANTCFGEMPSELLDDVSNYMDYTTDACRDHFTTGQSERMIATLATSRHQLSSVDNLIYTGVCDFQNMVSATFTPSSYQPCASSTTPVVFTPLVANATGATYLWDFGDGTTSTSTTTVSKLYSSATNSPFTVTLTITKAGIVYTYQTIIYVTACSPIQNSASNWYFGSRNGLKFGTGVPIPDNTLPTANAFRTCSAVQNTASGNLLFYTNGKTIWRVVSGVHTVLNASTTNTYIPLKGSRLAKNGALSLPIPGTTNFYLFTKGGIQNDPTTDPDYNNLDGFRRTTINYNGTTLTMPNATMNVPISPLPGMPSGYITGNDGALVGASGIAAFQHCSGYWIVVSLQKSTGRFLVTLNLTSTGLSYVSEIGLPSSLSTTVDEEDFKFSPNGNKVSYVCTKDDFNNVLMFDFDKVNGILSNMQYLFPLDGVDRDFEGGEFSADSNVFYTAKLFDEMYQFNINSANPQLTRKTLSATLQNRAIKRGPDNKIYFAPATSLSETQLAVIHNPSNLITSDNLNACNLSTNGPTFSYNLYNYAYTTLPNLVMSVPQNSISAYPTACNTFKFFANVTQTSCFTSFIWNFGDGSPTSTQVNPVHAFASPGTYTVTVHSSTNVFIAQTTIQITTLVAPTIGGSAMACATGQNQTINSVELPDGQTAVWSVSAGGTIVGPNNGEEVTVNWSTLPGTLTLTVTNTMGCTATSTQTISSFCPGTGANNSVFTTNLQSDGKIVFGGSFTSYNGTTRDRIARLNSDMSLDTSFAPGTLNSTVRCSAIQSDGKIVIGGNFTAYTLTSRNRVARLNANGSLDTGFNVGTGANGPVYAVAIQSDGKILIGGEFTTYNGVARNYIARLNSNGALDNTFTSGFSVASEYVSAIEIQSNGNILVGGYFSTYGGSSRNSIVRLTSTGALDTTFNPGTGFIAFGSLESVASIKVQSNGAIVVGGTFSYYNGNNRFNVIRLTSTGGVDTTFNPPTVAQLGGNVGVRSIFLQSNGEIVLGGGFNMPYRRIVRLNANGSLDSWDPGNGFGPMSGATPGVVYSLVGQPDGKVVTGGYFTSYNGESVSHITRLAVPGPGIGRTTEVDEDVTIYPNPASTHFSISTNTEFDKIEIVSSLGQSVKTDFVSRDNNSVSIEELSVGIYFVRIFDKGKLLKTEKLIKQ